MSRKKFLIVNFHPSFRENYASDSLANLHHLLFLLLFVSLCDPSAVLDVPGAP